MYKKTTKMEKEHKNNWKKNFKKIKKNRKKLKIG